MVSETLRPFLERDIDGIAANSRRIRANGVHLHLLDYPGPGPGRQPLVIIPGITTAAIGWDFVASVLREKRRVIVLDVRGRGLSDHPADGYRLHDYAEDLATVIETLRLDEPVLLGHSMGARIAAATAIFHPRIRLSGLLLAEPPLSGPGRPRYPVPLCDLLTQIRRARSGMVAEDVAKRYPGWPPRELALRARWLATCSDAAVTATHHSFESDDFFAMWDTLDSPVLIYGERSSVVTETSLAELRRRNQHARIRKVRAAAHMLPWENYPETMRLLENVLYEVARETDE